MEEWERRVAPGQDEMAFEGPHEKENASRRERELSYGAGDGLHVLNP